MVKVGKHTLLQAREEAAPLFGFQQNRLASIRQALGRAINSEPPPMKDDKDATLSTDPGGQLFVDDVTADDVEQGAIGDCYFVAALSAVADNDPQRIRDAIKDNGDGTYTVRFFNEKNKPVDITVDADLYHNSWGGLVYADSEDADELWPSIMEKAYAKWKGGFDKIGNGGDPAAALQALTGHKSKSYGHGNTSADKVWQQLSTGAPAVAATPGEDKKKALDGTNIVSWHAYTVEGTEEIDGQRYVVLRNPWGSTELTSSEYATDVDGDGDGADDGNDGEFRIRLDDYMRLFSRTYVNS